ncbi:putative FAD-binding domain-containing protein [Colletotrichum sublineola]|uniref:Putative FAD-binding domain-containing protein n=1 Tax=Colletotrichum sublineola TaxID=1173701 RepID=A0A066WX11_COLSU|nr:putative FAD-binding domain-containing protein [Colletotrichum sublineola]
MEPRRTSSVYSDTFELDDLLLRLTKQADEQDDTAISLLQQQNMDLYRELMATRRLWRNLIDLVRDLSEVYPAIDTLAKNDDSHVASQAGKNKDRAMFAGSAQSIDRSRETIFPGPARTPDIEWNSPWKQYREAFQLHDLGGSLTVAVREGTQAHIRKLAVLESTDALLKFRRLRHQNIVEFTHAYMTDACLYAVFEPTSFSLLHLAKCPKYPDEAQLGAIVSQVVDGLSYLEAEGFEQPTLDSSNMLVTDAGLVKIANQELCRPLTGRSQHHIKAVSRVVQLLMQKYEKETPGIDDLNRWPPDSHGFTFLVAIDSASSVDQLQNHPLMRHRVTECLLGLLSLALHRHSLFGPWNAVSLLVPTLYMAVNAFCLAFRPSTMLSRSGNLALLNTLPLFASPCLDLTADILAIPLRHYAAMHRWLGRVAAMLLAVHIVSAMQNDQYQVQVPDGVGELLMLVGSIAMVAAATVTFLPFFRRRIYELCLRTHQALSALAVVGAALHLLSVAARFKLWLGIYLAVTTTTTLAQGCLIAFRNKAMGHTFGRAYIDHVTGTVQVSIKLSRPLKFEAGQYLLLWIPRVRLFECHPFVVTSWAEAEQSIVDLFIKPRRGFTSSLVRYSNERVVP